MSTLGSRLRNTRKGLKLTLNEVSRRTEISLSFLSDIERDYTEPSLTTLRKLAHGYGVTVASLLEEKNVQGVCMCTCDACKYCEQLLEK